MSYLLYRIKRRWVSERVWRLVCRIHRAGLVGRILAKPLARVLTRELCEFERFKYEGHS